MPIAMRSSNGALNRIVTFMFVFSCSCSFRILDHVFTDTSTRFRRAFEPFLSSLFYNLLANRNRQKDFKMPPKTIEIAGRPITLDARPDRLDLRRNLPYRPSVVSLAPIYPGEKDISKLLPRYLARGSRSRSRIRRRLHRIWFGSSDQLFVVAQIRPEAQK
jgi:hypothetical protein